MPFKSQAQRRWMHANKPDMAKRWEAETAGPIPEKVVKRKVAKGAYKAKRR